MSATALPTQPNILLLLVDQLYFPPYAPQDGGMVPFIREIFAFEGDLAHNPYRDVFPGFCKLREFGVLLADHTIAESACIPSRASLMTGQYGPRTGVTQTDGLFKSGDAGAFPWLPPNGTPTMGDWLKAAGYSTHYFGKWHVSNPREHSLRAYGFADWELSWPEPHGSLVNNLGTFRDYQFADLACAFLRNQGLGVPYNRSTAQQDLVDPLHVETPPATPFFAVCSFTNPHDIAAYPALCRQLSPEMWDEMSETWVKLQNIGPGQSVPVPLPGSVSAPPKGGTLRVPLNPNGLPQDCATAPPTMAEDLLTNNKPTAHYDYSVKVGLGLSAKTGLGFAQGVSAKRVSNEEPPLSPEEVNRLAVEATLAAGAPFNTQHDAAGAALGFLQYYVYMMSMVDRHILSVLNTLEQSGLLGNTLLVFAADHGEMGAAHGMMMEKWHVAYQEVVHVPVLFRHPALNPSKTEVRRLGQTTSHIDLLPTLLGFAGADVSAVRASLSRFKKAAPLPGLDLSQRIQVANGEAVQPGEGDDRAVLFVTDDLITAPLPKDADPHNLHSWAQYGVYAQAVDILRGAAPSKLPVAGKTPQLAPGPVCQPCHVRALRAGVWKLVRYCDPWSAAPVPDQWELYHLGVDPYEQTNLVVATEAVPTLTPTAASVVGMDQAALEEVLKGLRAELGRQEAELLSPYPAAHPSANLN